MILNKNDLWSLEQYAVKRAAFKNEVLAHKKNREVKLTGNARLLFEDKTTIRYQIQEMLRIEKIFEPAGIQDELDAYNPLIPNGHNWKATLMLEYEDVEKRQIQLQKLIGVEDHIWVSVGSHAKVYAIADEDLERENDVKTSSVHFLRFELSNAMIKSAKQGETIAVGCDHPNLNTQINALQPDTAQSLVNDLNG